MRIDELSWFLHLGQNGRVTRSAEDLHISQPALSRAVNRLENEIGCPLFERNPAGWTLTEFGEILFAHSSRALAELAAAQLRIESRQDPDAGTVSIGYVTSFGSWLVPELVLGFKELHPRGHFTLRGGPADQVLEWVRSGQVDAGITSPRPAGQDLEWVPLAIEELGLAVHNGHPLAGAEDVNPRDIVDEPMVALGPAFGLRQISDAYLAAHDVSPVIVMEATELSTLRGLVEYGAGIAILPLLKPPPDVTVIPFQDHRAVRTAGLVFDSHRRRGPAVSRFIEFAREHGAESRTDLPSTIRSGALVPGDLGLAENS